MRNSRTQKRTVVRDGQGKDVHLEHLEDQLRSSFCVRPDRKIKALSKIEITDLINEQLAFSANIYVGMYDITIKPGMLSSSCNAAQ